MRLWKFADPARKLVRITMLASTTIGTMAMLPLSAHADESGTATVAWLRDGKVEVRGLSGAQSNTPPSTSANTSSNQDGKATEQKIPLGSLWKLFVYAYLQDNRVQESAYTCNAKKEQRSKLEKDEERYCCEPGDQVQRDSALARSCAPYFSPARLGLNDKDWKNYWQTRSDATWLQRTAQLQPDTQISIRDLLETLAKFSPQARAAARTALLETAVQGYGREAWAQLGTGIRYKTYSWHLPDQSAFGGAAGWLADGTPFWFGARGSSRSALGTWASALATTLPAPRWAGINSMDNVGDEAHCVDVDFFARYPLREVLPLPVPVNSTASTARAGTMTGKFRLQFANGNTLDINSNGSLSLQRLPGMAPQITGRFSVNDYVARVVDREGDAANVQAARSLAIAARSYLVQNAALDHGCWRIADATSRQRVSANPPTEAAMDVAWFTDDLILQGANVRYHNDSAGTNRMSLKDAAKQASQGWNFERILAASYPQASIASFNGKSDCQPLAAAQTWLINNSSKWQAILRREPGFENPDMPPAVCALATGNPYSDQKRMRIYARGWRSLDERITLAHEYLHLALRFHPNGANEDYVEKLARRLIEGST
ncbi:DUF2300 domain-containing protein [Undibacterium sp. CY18W]|uniref:DUF2300 domain-containing protein n=1 Tax=Undibacterium hunanense TaxID=2762292 RepID=A0ABR6ZT62_9BURK|nr:DUF2300 domain-containing protein [Undibacterium hunanense]MBC3919076.1 DUF2300 domain-containing protein [Undibacterium hunanense]